MGDDRSDDGGEQKGKTHRGFATPGIGESSGFDDKTVADPPRALAPRGPDESGELYLPPGSTKKHDDQPLVEIEVVHQHGPAPRMQQPAQTLEIWTQNRIYTMDPSNICVAVTDRKSGQDDLDHPFLGFKLVGGQHRDGETFELSYPYPRPGTEAVFEHPSSSRGNFSRTSTVTRVVLRMHVVTVAQQRVVPTWTDITKSEIAIPPE